jgi:Tol biopolymer transport system component
MLKHLGRRLPVLLTLLVVSMSATTSYAQEYFGRNKVHYKKLEFEVLKTEHFDIYFYPSAREGIDIAARMAERWYSRLEKLLEHQLRGRQALILYGSHVDFEQTNVLQGELGEGTGGVTESIRRRIILPLGGPLADTDHVIGHELVHAFQFDMTTTPGAAPGEVGVQALPLWFVEGMAEYLSIGPVDTNTAMWLRDAARRENDRDRLPTIEQLNNPEYFPYRWGHAFWAYVGGKWGDAVVGEMLRIAGATRDIEVATQRVLGLSTKELSEEWQASIRAAYGKFAGETNNVGRVILKGKGMGDELNIGPTVSPDGKLISFLSGRSLFSIDLFIADAANGKILRKLTSTATDPHYSSIQFIDSAGAWDFDSRRIAIATVTSGQPALTIFDARSGDKERDIPIPTLDEIFNPAWAPNGQAITFTGMSRGLTDLYVYDLGASQLRQLTNDPFADLQPAWSPDGKRIAFATDRFSSDMATLSIGAYRIALVDPATGAVEAVRAFTGGRNSNPQWSPDGSELYFVSDRDGVSNLYRLNLARSEISQMTNLVTGISGITPSSPAMSVAGKEPLAVFNVYEDGGYDVRALPIGPGARATALTEVVGTPGTLPPLDRRPSQVAALLGNSSQGLPPPQTFEVEDYDAKLALEAIGQPSIAVGADRFGAAVAGGLSFYFSDMLGDHSLGAAFQLNSNVTGNFSFKDTAAQVVYFNQAQRWNWGLVGGQVPYMTGFIQQSLSNIGGEPVLIQDTTILRQTERTAAAVLSYPFNRAQRVEFQGGFTQIAFDQIVRTQVVSLVTENLLSDETNETSLGRDVALATPSAALVYDTTNYGATSPVAGQRYRLEASPTFGTVSYTGVLADYRRYFMPWRFYTLAGRVLHYGRYGSESEDSRLFPLYIGYPTLVRGYDINTFEPTECRPTEASECPAYDRLIGSRLLVANLEFRFPLLRPFGVSQNMYGPVPIEVALFADAGVAWGRNQDPKIFGGTREGVSSVGAAVRANFFGFITQFSFARPLQRPERDWIFQWTFSPGF